MTFMRDLNTGCAISVEQDFCSESPGQQFQIWAFECRPQIGACSTAALLFCRNMRDLGSPVHGLRLFEAVFATFGDRARLYLTSGRDDQHVGGGVAIEFGSSITVPWASSLRMARTTCPNHSLYWKILSDAIHDGKATFDFGRSRVGAGTYSFKKQWGAEPRALMWSSFDARGEPEEEHDYNPDRHDRVVRAWRRLPLAVTKWIGPLIRRRLAN